MSTRIANSPSVTITERDFSLVAPNNVGTSVFITGFTAQGPSDEVVKITTRDELDAVYGTPTNSAERYFYHGVRELLNSPANIYAFRLPYGPGSGAGFGSQYSALVYPVQSFVPSTSAVTSSLNLSAATYVLGEPVHVVLSETQYQQAQEGVLFDWSDTSTNQLGLSTVADLGKAGVIVLNKSQTTINGQFEGYYVAVSDNTNINPSSNFDSVLTAKTVSTSATFVGLSGGTGYTSIPNGTLQFNLSATFNGASNSISQIMEGLTDYNIDGREDDDLLGVGVFKLRKSVFATESFKLDYVLDDRMVGSIDSFRTQLNPLGGPAVPFFLESVDTNSRNVEILVNPYISNKFGNSSQDSSGIPRKKIRVLTRGLVNNNNPVVSGVTTAALNTIAATLGYADNLYALGSFTDVQITQKTLGSVPSKIDRALQSIINDEIYDIDVVVEAGLGTIYAMSNAANTTYYDDTLYNSTLKTVIDSLRTSGDISGVANATNIRSDYTTIFNKFENFCDLPSKTGGRGDCMFIADILRHILVTGKNTKVLSDRTRNFQTDIYWAMRHQLELENTSYAAVYGNWAQVYDEFMGEKVWVPFSSVAAATFAKNDSIEFPWSAPAGYTRGLVSGNVLDLAITPNQKHRDELYKSNINPVLFSPSQGMAIFGQKTLSRKPSAFDRINVRRCFFALERPTKKASIFYVFEPNNTFTRTRLLNTLTPIFEYAKENGGVYDYILVCDERNNTAQVIDNNELRVTALVKPTRTAEFITIEFGATTSNANFDELI